MRMKISLKRDISAKFLWGLALAAVAVKLILCSQQLFEAVPLASTIDDGLMMRLATSIREGNWLGEYDYLTLGKHSFFALWLAFLNVLHVNFLVGGQLLYAAACLVLLAAVKPLFCTNAARGLVFLAVLWLPASWAQFTLRVYRDNIYPALVLLALGGLVGRFAALPSRPKRPCRTMLLRARRWPPRGCATRTTPCCCPLWGVRRRCTLCFCSLPKRPGKSAPSWRCFCCRWRCGRAALRRGRP